MADRARRCWRRLRRPRRGERGASLLETVGIVGMAGLMLAPLLSLSREVMVESRTQQTARALEVAREALIAFAARHDGCLPFAADDEGGKPLAGDTGESRSGKRSGDLPWADLGLGPRFTDGDGTRIQYYVASQYVDVDGDPSNGIACLAEARGGEWDPRVGYEATPDDPIYLRYTDPAEGTRHLYELTATLPAGTPPPALGSGDIADVTHGLPETLLQARRGPDVAAGDEQSEIVSARNVFVLIAPGTAFNFALERTHIRDASHRGDESGVRWPYNDDAVDGVVFSSMTQHSAVPDQGASGDDTLFAESFTRFKQDLNARGVRVEPICASSC